MTLAKLTFGVGGLLLLLVAVVPSENAFAGQGSPHSQASSPAGQKARVQSADAYVPLQESKASADMAVCLPSALRAMLAVFAALLVAMVPATEAQAAKSGGRIGGSAASRPATRPPPPRPSAPRAAEPPRVENKTTVVEKTVIVAPPPPPPVVVAPPVSPFGGMMGAPVVVAPPPTLGDVVVGAAISSAINSAMPKPPSTTDRIMENQIRQDERQMDRQQSQIEDMQRELRELKQK
mmetsp:Transcript_31305/g.68588  ORF Transcript_31305/g.68588 Transcript_31305/m.68588 type:complete len:236 (+) Transcript_31305:52-759(+)